MSNPGLLLLLAGILLSSAECQIRRNIAYSFLTLDKNRDFLLSGEELGIEKESIKDPQAFNFTWDKFETFFPIIKFFDWDKNQDNQMSPQEFDEMVKEDFIEKQTPVQGFTSFSKLFPSKSMYRMCCEDGIMNPHTFGKCLTVWISFQNDFFVHKIPSLYYKDTGEGLSSSDFKQLLLSNTQGQSSGIQDQRIQSLFHKFDLDGKGEIDQSEIRLMEPTLLLASFDRNRDGKLSQPESTAIFSNNLGGSKVFEFADMNDDEQISLNELISHMIFALDIKEKAEVQINEQKVLSDDL